MERGRHALLVIAVLIFVSRLLVASSFAGAKDSGKKWGAKLVVVV